MSSDEPRSQIRPLPPVDEVVAPAIALPPGAADVLGAEASHRPSYLVRTSIAIAVALVLALLGYEAFVAPADDGSAWKPPAGLSAGETPVWLQTLCIDRTRELCTAADRARTASDCDAMRAALSKLEAVDRKLAARGDVSARQHWVLVELYGQGHELCEFERAGQPGGKAP
jgi:hypothetical protein